MSVKRYDCIKSEAVPGFIRGNFRKVTGTLSCTNPHWWLHFMEDYIVYEYQCCDYEYCDFYDYEKYTDVEKLIADHLNTLIDNDDWWWA